MLGLPAFHTPERSGCPSAVRGVGFGASGRLGGHLLRVKRDGEAGDDERRNG